MITWTRSVQSGRIWKIPGQSQLVFSSFWSRVGYSCLCWNSELKNLWLKPNLNLSFLDFPRYCKVQVQKELLGDLLPGPVTLVFERSETLNADLNPFTSVSFPLQLIIQTKNLPMGLWFSCPRVPQLVGVRIPDHAFMRRLCQMCGEPLALTSANISAHTSTVEVHVSGETNNTQILWRSFLMGRCFCFIFLSFKVWNSFFNSAVLLFWRSSRSSGQN